MQEFFIEIGIAGVVLLLIANIVDYFVDRTLGTIYISFEDEDDLS